MITKFQLPSTPSPQSVTSFMDDIFFTSAGLPNDFCWKLKFSAEAKNTEPNAPITAHRKLIFASQSESLFQIATQCTSASAMFILQSSFAYRQLIIWIQNWIFRRVRYMGQEKTLIAFLRSKSSLKTCYKEIFGI